jgi:hypothetical protein
LDEIDQNQTLDEIENVGSGGLEVEESRLTEFERRRRRRTSGKQKTMCQIYCLFIGLVNRKWSALINRKLHLDADTDNDSELPFVDIEMPENNLANVIVNNSLEFMAAGIEVYFTSNVYCNFSLFFRQSWKTM